MNKCRYCTAPARRILCGASECKRRYNAERARRHEVACRRCGKTFKSTSPAARWCSNDCAPRDARKARRLRKRVENLARRASEGTAGSLIFVASSDGTLEAVEKTVFWTQKSSLRIALESGDGAAVIAAILPDTAAQGECRVWTRTTTDDGYPKVKVGGRTVSVHRLIAEAAHGPLDGMAIHHTCANRTCVAPAHLQPVTHYDNAAEMLERNWYLKRIALLESALAAAAPRHPLLKVQAHKSRPAA